MHAAGLSWSRTAALMEFGVDILFFWQYIWTISSSNNDDDWGFIIQVRTLELPETTSFIRPSSLFLFISLVFTASYLQTFLVWTENNIRFVSIKPPFCGDMWHCLMISGAVKQLQSVGRKSSSSQVSWKSPPVPLHLGYFRPQEWWQGINYANLSWYNLISSTR